MKLSDKFLLRTPLLPLNIDNLSEHVLLELFSKDYIKESIYLSSPVLYNELEKLSLSSAITPKERNKLIISFAKYITRMQSRCTPYGLFAACTVGTFAQKNNTIIPEIEKTRYFFKRSTRPDMDFLCEYANHLSKRNNIKQFIKFYPNSTLYKFSNTYRYVEYYYSGNSRLYQISSVQHSTYLELVLAKSKSGEEFTNLVNVLISPDINYEEAEYFINELIENQILTSELEPSVTGKEFMYQLIQSLKFINIRAKSEEIETVILELINLQEKLDTLDLKLINDVTVYKALFNSALSLGFPIKENQLFQVDLFRNIKEFNLDEGIKQKILLAVYCLNKIRSNSENSSLKLFREQFYDRYGDADIPLLEALDSETGIGYPEKNLNGTSVLIDDIPLRGQNNNSVKTNLDFFQEILFKKYEDACRCNAKIIELTDKDLAELDENEEGLPATLAVHYEIVTSENKVLIKSLAGPSATVLLGRFAHANEDVNKLIEEITTFEKLQHKNKLIAEIVHLPENRLGNVILRPIFREYEIPYLAKSILPEDFQIHPRDICISVSNDKIILKSIKLKKEIIPRLSTAHNYISNTLPVYRFLGDMQLHDCTKGDLSFTWGQTVRSAVCLPRVQYKGVILSLASWHFKKSDYLNLLDTKDINEVKKWAERHSLPDYISISEGDNELLISLCNTLSIYMFLNFIRNKNEIIVKEFLHDVNESLIKGETGKAFTNEFVGVIYNSSTKSSENNIDAQEFHPKRIFAPGSEWCYFKIYCGVKSADKILETYVAPLVEKLINEDLIEKWYFIRYYDSDWHLRIRLKLKDSQRIGKAISYTYTLLDSPLQNGIISKIQIDTYIQETRRYGIKNIGISESVFYIDSEMVLAYLKNTNPIDRDTISWKFALKMVDDTLSIFNLNLNDKYVFTTELKNNFIAEHKNNKELKINLDEKYRVLKNEISEIMSKTGLICGEVVELNKLLDSRNSQIRNEIQTLLNQNTINNNYKLLSSYIHMMLNRLFNNRQRVHEMAIYYLINKYYKSQVTQSNRNNNLSSIVNN